MSHLSDLLLSASSELRTEDQDLLSDDAAGETSSEDGEEAQYDLEPAEVALHAPEGAEEPLQKRRRSADAVSLEVGREASGVQTPQELVEDTTMTNEDTLAQIELVMDTANASPASGNLQAQSATASPTEAGNTSATRKKKSMTVPSRELASLFEAHKSAPAPRNASKAAAATTSTATPSPSTSTAPSVPFTSGGRKAVASAASKIKATMPAETKEVREQKQREREDLIMQGYDSDVIAEWDRANPGIKPLAIRQTAANTKPKKATAASKAKSKARDTASPAPNASVGQTDYSALASIGISPTRVSFPNEPYHHSAGRDAPAATEPKKKAAGAKGSSSKGAKGTKAKASSNKSKAAKAVAQEAEYTPHVGTSRQVALAQAAGEPIVIYPTYVAQPEVEEEEDDRLYCVCQTLYDEDRMMIACDHCDNWYHPDCLGIDETRIQLIENFVCPDCEKTSPKRTTYHPACAREDCLEPAVPLSRYCSDWCGITVVGARVEAMEGKPNLNLDVLMEAVRGLEKEQCVVEDVLTMLSEPPDPWSAGQLRRLQDSLKATRGKRRAVEQELESVIRREQYLHNAVKRSEQLVTAHNAANPVASQKSKKSKKNPHSASAQGDAPCGFDVRLVWDDRDLQAWADGEVQTGEEEEGLICMVSRRKCDRHTGWQKTKEADYFVERKGVERRIGALEDQERDLSGSLEVLRESTRSRGTRPTQSKENGIQDDMDIDITPHVEVFEIPPTPGVAFTSARDVT